MNRHKMLRTFSSLKCFSWPLTLSFESPLTSKTFWWRNYFHSKLEHKKNYESRWETARNEKTFSLKTLPRLEKQLCRNKKKMWRRSKKRRKTKVSNFFSASIDECFKLELRTWKSFSHQGRRIFRSTFLTCLLPKLYRETLIIEIIRSKWTLKTSKWPRGLWMNCSNLKIT